MPKLKTRTANIYAIAGSDEAAVKREAAALARKLAPAEAGEFGLETIDGAADNVEQAAGAIRSTIAALQTLPFFGGGKLVWLKSSNFLSDDVKGKSANVLEPLEDLGALINSGLPADVTLLISAVDPDKRRSFYKTLAKVAEIEVRELVPVSRASVIFELGNALGQHDVTRALRLVRDLLDQGETAIGILLATLLPTIRNLLLAKDLMERYRLSRPHAPFAFISTVNRLPEPATAHLPRKKDGTINSYALGLGAMNAHRFETDQLVDAMQACLEANLQLVTTQLDHQLVLTEVVIKLLSE